MNTTLAQANSTDMNNRQIKSSQFRNEELL